MLRLSLLLGFASILTTLATFGPLALFLVMASVAFWAAWSRRAKMSPGG